MFVLAEISGGREAEAVAALQGLTAAPALWLTSAPVPKALPTPPSPEAVSEELAQAIAEAIRPTAKQTMRLEALRAALKGYDSFMDQQGSADPAMRNALVALSKALRPFSIWDSPLDLLATRERRLVKDGPYKGQYESTVYRPTPLGQRVRKILEEKGVKL